MVNIFRISPFWNATTVESQLKNYIGDNAKSISITFTTTTVPTDATYYFDWQMTN